MTYSGRVVCVKGINKIREGFPTYFETYLEQILVIFKLHTLNMWVGYQYKNIYWHSTKIIRLTVTALSIGELKVYNLKTPLFIYQILELKMILDFIIMC